MSAIKKLISCRVCTTSTLYKVFSLGPTPLANAFLKKEQLDLPEYYYPLDVMFCKNCSFVQLGHVVNPKLLFENYVYASSTSSVFVDHFRNFAQEVSKKYLSRPKSLVVDIGSNDGILLLPFKELGAKILGIEPGGAVAKIAKKKKIPTIESYFSVKLAKSIVKSEGQATIITATNVFAHIDDLDEVITGVKVLLEDNGVFIIEAPYLVDFIEKRYFDLVYHEHLSYWSIKTFQTLFNRHEMEIIDVQKVAVHGGSVRVFVQKKTKNTSPDKSVNQFLTLEKKFKLEKIHTFLDYGKLIQENKVNLLKLLAKLKSQGKIIAGYGAPAKGNTLLNFFSLGTETLDFIIDDSPLKQGLFTPGKHIPVMSSKELYRKKPDYLLLLAWNFAESIMKTHQKYQETGGKFIIPVPRPKIVS